MVNGPFDDIAQYPMENALGITPKFDSFTASSKMCGNCHTINLPNIGQYPAWFTPQDSGQVLKRIEKNPAFKSYNHSIEQATYLEWLNSDFGPGADNTPKSTFKSCQDCHMPRSLSLPRQGIDIDTQPVASQGVGPLIDVWQESGEDPAGIHESHRSGGTKRCWREGAYRPASPTQWRLEWEEVHS